MFGMPTVKIGLVGGQGYGKTVFLASLLELAHRSEKQCITLFGSPNAETNKKYTAWLTSFRNDGQKIETTKELLDVKYVLGAVGAPQWKLRFKDFSGENLDGEIELPGCEDALEKQSETTEVKRGKVKSNVERDKEDLEKWFNSCDVLIFLLPVNVVEHDYLIDNPKGSTDIKTEKKLAILQAYVQQIKASGKIACLALNKADLVPDEMKCEELIERVPAIGRFYRALQSCFGKDHVFCHKVSAFGKHKNDDSCIADAHAEPFGVAEMIEEVVPREEGCRLEKFFAKYAAVGKLGLFARYARVPCLFFEALGNAMRGIADKTRRDKNLGIIKRSGRRFAIECIASLAVIVGATVFGNMQAQEMKYNKIEESVSKGFDSAKQIVKIKDSMGEEPQWSLFNWNAALLRDQRLELGKKIDDATTKFNDNLLEGVKKKWDDLKGEIENMQRIAPVRRSNDVEVVFCVATNALASMTADAVSQRGKVKDILKELESHRVSITEHFDIDKQYHAIVAETNKKDQYRAATDFLKRETEFPDRGNLFKTVRELKQNIECDEFGRLTNQLHQTKYANDYDDKTNDYTNRIKRCNERVELINQFRNDFPDSEVDNECRNLIGEEESRIAYLDKNGHFDSDLIELRSHASEMDYLIHVEKFLDGHPATTFVNRTSELGALQNVIRSNETSMVTDVTKQITSDDLSDSTNLSWEVRLERIDRRSEIITNCMSRLTKRSDFRQQLAKQIENDKNLGMEINGLHDYYLAFDSTMNKEKEYRVAAIDDFMRRFGNGQYPNVPARYGEAKMREERERLMELFKSKLRETMQVQADNDKSDWPTRKKAARARLEELRRYATATGDNKDTEIKDTEDFIRNCDSNIEFDKSVSAIVDLAELSKAKDLFEKIYTFYGDYPEREWLNRKDDYAKVRKIESERISMLRNELSGKLGQNQSRDSVDTAITACRTRIRLLEGFKGNLHAGMKEGREAEDYVRQERDILLGLQHIKTQEGELGNLLVEAGALANDDDSGITTFLNGVYRFSESLPDGKVDNLIESKYNNVLEFRDKFDKVLEEEMNSRLKPHQDALQDSTLADDDRIKEENASVAILGQYLPKFCPNGRIYDKVAREYAQRITNKDTLKARREIRTKLAELYNELKDNALSSSAKKEKINHFFDEVASYGDEKDFPDLSNEFMRLHTTVKGLEWKIRFEELREKVKNEIKGLQGNESKEQLEIYLAKVNKCIGELERFVADPRTKDDAKAISDDVKCEAGVAKTRIESLRLWDDVEIARTKYVQKPSSRTYDEYKSACERYRANPSPKNSGFEMSMKECAEMEIDRKALEDVYRTLCQNPSVYNVERLIEQKIKAPLLRNMSIYKFARECELWKLNGQTIGVGLHGYDFCGRFKCESWAVDFYADFRVDDNSCFVIEKEGIGGYDRNSPNNMSQSGFAPHQLTHRVVVPSFNSEIKVQFANKSGHNKWSGLIPKKFVEILVDAALNKGTARETFYTVNKADHGGHLSSVTFEFSGLPFVEE